MDWKRLLAYITGSVDQELLLRNEYLVTENRLLRQQITGRIRLRGYPKTFSHCHSKIKQHPCGNETQDDRRERAYSA